MLVYSPDTFLLAPGALLLAAGLGLSAALAVLGPFTLGGIGINLHWMLLGITCATLGYSCIQIGIVARIMHGLRSGIAGPVQRWLAYDRGMAAAGVFVVAGLLLVGRLGWHYIQGGMRLNQISYPGIFGLLLIILGFQTFGFTLLLEMAQRVIGKRPHS
jgi:hypothetical protein